MSYLKKVELDEEARRYLKHFEVFEGTRARALSYLDQLWHALALTLRKLSAQPHYMEMKVELLGGSSAQGVKWSGLVSGERVYLELSDVRSWPSMSGVWVGCALGAEGRSGRELIRQRVTDDAAHALLPQALQEMSAPLTFGIESDRQLCLPLPITARPPSEEAQALLGYGLSLWGLLNGDLHPSPVSTSVDVRRSLPSVLPQVSAEPQAETQRAQSDEAPPSEASDELDEVSDPYGYGFYQEEPADDPVEERPAQVRPSLSERARRLAEELSGSEPPAPQPARHDDLQPASPKATEAPAEERLEPASLERPPMSAPSAHTDRSADATRTSDATPDATPELERTPRRLGHVTPLSTPLQLDDEDEYLPVGDPEQSQVRSTRPQLRPRPSARRGRARSVAPPRMPEAEFEQLSADELEEQLRHLSKDEMIALIAQQRRAQQSVRPVPTNPAQPRVIGGGGRRDLSSVTGEAERFIPKRLEDTPPPPRPSGRPLSAEPPLSVEQPSSPFDAPPPSAPLPPQEHAPATALYSEESAPSLGEGARDPSGDSQAHEDSAQAPQASLMHAEAVPSSAPIQLPGDPSADEREARDEGGAFEPASVPTAPPVVQGAQVQLFAQDPENVAPPSYIKSIQQESQELEIFTQALTRCGLPPWRINSYAEGQGKIIWLSNGAHIDIAPDGEVTLGGESQDDTRARLARVGITFTSD